MERVYSGKSVNEQDIFRTVNSDGSRIYFNSLQASEELNRVFSECWNSLSTEKKEEINRKIKEMKKGNDRNGYISGRV